MGEQTLDIVRVRQSLAQKRETLAEARIVAQFCHQQFDEAERDESRAEQSLFSTLKVIEELSPDVWAQLTEDERARG